MSGQSKTSGVVGTSQYSSIMDVIQALNRYVSLGIHPGGGIGAVLENDLRGAMVNFDGGMERLRLTVTWMHNRAPAACWGSKEVVEKWMGHRGMADWQTDEDGEGV